MSTLKRKEFDFIHGDTVFSLSTNGTSTNNYASLYFENNAIKLALPGANDMIAPDVCTGFSAEMRGSNVYLDWQDAADNIGVANYLYRWSKSTNFDGDGILTQGSSVTINAPDKGNYYYQVRSVDCAGNLSAWSAVQSFTVTAPRPDIVVNSLKLSAASIFDTKSVRVSFTIKSNYLPAAASCVCIYAGSSKIATLSVPELKVGESKHFTTTISGKKLAVGKNTISVVADASSLVKESNEKNNRVTIALNVIKAFVNLTVENFKISQNTIITKQALKINFTVKNSGNVESKASSAYVYDGKKIVGKVSIKAIAAGKSLTASYTVSAGKFAFGIHQLYILADGGKTIAESNEKDNQTASLTVKVSATPKISKVSATVKGYSATLMITPAANVKVAKYVVTYGKINKTITSNSLKLNNLAVGKVAVSVVAYDAAGNKSSAKKVNLTIKDTTPPSKVVTLKNPVVTSKYKGTFSWSAAKDNSGKIARYEIQLDNGKIYKSTKTSVSISKLTVGKHTYRVRAIDKNKNVGAWSSRKSFTVKDMTAPSNVAVKVKVSGNNAVLTWKKPKDNVGVTKYLLTCNGKTVTLKGSVTKYTITGLNKGKYSYSMVAVDAANNKSKAKTGKITIKQPLAPARAAEALYAADFAAPEALFAPQTDILAYCNDLQGAANLSDTAALTTDKKEERSLLAALS